MSAHNHGLESLRSRSLFDTIWQRRTHRVSRGSDVAAGEMSYKSTHARAPLSALEEAVLIAATGCTGLSMPDRPFYDPRNGQPIMAKPNVNMVGRTAGSPDNAQGTHFFMINDSGTYFLRKLPPADGDPFDADLLLKRAEMAKVKLLDQRIDVPGGNRDFPAYLDSNRFLSNLPGTTVFFPVVDLSHQYINGMMYLLTQPAGARPNILDDRNFYFSAGAKKWVNKGFLNKDIPLPLGVIWSMRTQIEADLLIQNQFLVAEAMGLGAWIHGSMSPPVLMGDPKFIQKYGPMLGFDFVTPKWKVMDALRWQLLLPWKTNARANPVGLRHNGEILIKGSCPPYYDSMSAAVDDVVAAKFGPKGIYSDPATFDKIYRGTFGETYLKEASAYSQDVIDCTRDICTYVYETHGRFPAHVDAIQAPGIWLQIHHVEQEYYDTYFQHGLTQVHRDHDRLWHGGDASTP
jgi:hypothetical protein